MVASDAGSRSGPCQYYLVRPPSSLLPFPRSPPVGLKKRPLYQRWINIRRNCGHIRGRTAREERIYAGVRVCPEWEGDFQAFERWCLGNGWEPGKNIARIDKTKDYDPSNCIVAGADVTNVLRRCVKKAKMTTVFGLDEKDCKTKIIIVKQA